MEMVREINDKYAITSADKISKYTDEFINEDREHFIVLGLDTKNRVIYRDIVTIGTLNATIIHPREVFKKACIMSCNSIILVHNHPSGDPAPSEEDKKITKLLKQAGEILSIKVLDHIIIGSEGKYSFKENNFI